VIRHCSNYGIFRILTFKRKPRSGDVAVFLELSAARFLSCSPLLFYNTTSQPVDQSGILGVLNLETSVLNVEVPVLNVDVPVLKAGKSACTRTQRSH
jgi:hypothetical protein